MSGNLNLTVKTITQKFKKNKTLKKVTIPPQSFHLKSQSKEMLAMDVFPNGSFTRTRLRDH